MAVFLCFYPKIKMNIRKAELQILATDFTLFNIKLQIFRKNLRDKDETL